MHDLTRSPDLQDGAELICPSDKAGKLLGVLPQCLLLVQKGDRFFIILGCFDRGPIQRIAVSPL
jgi:hypothetical protein